ncbi:MAG: hypothetical protein ABR599_00365, partial [Gemmatimonadota bacterium]
LLATAGPATLLPTALLTLTAAATTLLAATLLSATRTAALLAPTTLLATRAASRRRAIREFVAAILHRGPPVRGASRNPHGFPVGPGCKEETDRDGLAAATM